VREADGRWKKNPRRAGQPKPAPAAVSAASCCCCCCCCVAGLLLL